MAGGGLSALGFRFSKADIGMGASTAHSWRQAVTNLLMV
jgi:hypothetical protein